jgi:uncharacterized membrane protein (GlpM family)
MADYLIRFFIGGLVVSLFAVIGDILRPKSFAGLFGAAPSVALATLALTVSKNGADYAATETAAMMLGAVALCAYCLAVCQLTMRFRFFALSATTLALIVWFGVAFGLKWILVAGA